MKGAEALQLLANDDWQQLLTEDQAYLEWCQALDDESLERRMTMDMSKFAGSESKYLKAADLMGKSIKVIIEEVSLLEFEDNGKTIVKPALALKGKEKQVVCNATSVSDLIQAYGAKSEAWIGKEIRLSSKHYPKFGRDGIVITPLETEAADDSIPF